MPYITIDQDKCKGCLLCVGVCPKGVISSASTLNPAGVKPVKPDKFKGCTGCLRCVLMCPECCIEVYK